MAVDKSLVVDVCCGVCFSSGTIEHVFDTASLSAPVGSRCRPEPVWPATPPVPPPVPPARPAAPPPAPPVPPAAPAGRGAGGGGAGRVPPAGLGRPPFRRGPPGLGHQALLDREAPRDRLGPPPV